MNDFDQPTVWAHTLASVPRRFLAAWLVGALGTAAPAALRDLGDFIEMGWVFIPAWPLLVFLFAMGSGWWGLIAVPLLFVLAWHMLRFVQDDHPDGVMAAKIFAIAYLAGIRASGDLWPVAVLPLAMVGVAYVRDKRNTPRDVPPNA